MLSLKKIKSRSSALKRMALPSAIDLGTTFIMSTADIQITKNIQIAKNNTGYVATIYDINVGYKSITIEKNSFDLKLYDSYYDSNGNFLYNRYEFINPNTLIINELLENPDLFIKYTGVFPVYQAKTNIILSLKK
jgi:hypothetical protein